MKVDFLRELFDYQVYEDRRVWDEAILPLDPELFTRDTGYSWGTLQRECVHVINVMEMTLQRAQGREIRERLSFDHAPERGVIRAHWDAAEAAWNIYLADMDRDEFFRLATSEYRGRIVSIPVWNLVFQMINHGTLHRAEMLKMVAELDQPVNFDLSTMQYFTRDV